MRGNIRAVVGVWGVVMSLAVGGVARGETAAGFGHGYIYPTYNAAGTPLLDSFYLRYSDGDHHVQSLGVEPQLNGQILIVLGDDNNDDEYYYSIEHKRRSDAGITTGSFVDFCNGSCLYPLAPPHAGDVFALRGFRFYYRGGDHHVDQIGILREADGVRTYFNDDNDDDPYVVYVDYAWLPAAMVTQTATLTGSSGGGGDQQAFASAASAVITGFRLDYADGDHHLQEIGVLTRTSDVQVYYGDDNGDDDFGYRVDLATLAPVRRFPPVGPILPIGGVLQSVSP